MTVIGQKSQASRSSVVDVQNWLWSASALNRKSRRSQSIVEDERNLYGAALVENVREGKPATVRESFRRYSQGDGQRASLSGKAPKSKSGLDRRGNRSVMFGSLKNSDRKDQVVNKKFGSRATEDSHSDNSVLGHDDQPGKHTETLENGNDKLSTRGESVGKTVSRFPTTGTVQRNLVRDHAIKAKLKEVKTHNDEKHIGDLHKDHIISVRPYYTKVSIGRRGEDKENRPSPATLERLYTRLYTVNTTLLGNAKASRRSVIIAAPARSGSSFLGDAFNQHHKVFYLFEPLYGVNPPSHTNDVRSMQFLDGILRCKFSSARYVQQIDRFRRFSSNALSSPPLCARKTYLETPKKRCESLKPANMEAVCKNNYSAVVMKVLTSRLPEFKIDSLFPVCKSSDCSVLYLVRDPRAVIFSHMKVGMIKWEQIANRSSYKAQNLRPRPLISIYSTSICQRMEQNVKVFRNLPREISRRFHMLRYEDIAKNPVETLRTVFKMAAGLEITNTTLRWIISNTGTDPKLSTVDETNEFSTKRNSKAVLGNWRLEMEPCFVDIVEESCRSVMNLLGYKLIKRSSKVQYDLNVPLVDD